MEPATSIEEASSPTPSRSAARPTWPVLHRENAVLWGPGRKPRGCGLHGYLRRVRPHCCICMLPGARRHRHPRMHLCRPRSQHGSRMLCWHKQSGMWIPHNLWGELAADF